MELYRQNLAVLCYNQIHLAYQSLISLQYSQLFLQCILGKIRFFCKLRHIIATIWSISSKISFASAESGNFASLIKISLRNWLRLDLPATEHSPGDLSKFKFVLSSSRVSWNLSSVTTFSCTHFAASSVNSQRFAGSGGLIYHFSWVFFEQKPLNSIVGREIDCFFRFRILTKIEWTLWTKKIVFKMCSYFNFKLFLAISVSSISVLGCKFSVIYYILNDMQSKELLP